MRSRAKQLHADNPSVDLHLDLGAIIKQKHRRGERKVLDKYFYQHFKAANFKVIVAAIYVDSEQVAIATRVALEQIATIQHDVADCNEHFTLINNKRDLEEVLAGDKIGIILSLEGAEPIADNHGLIDIFYQLGVRLIGLTWSRRNFVADGCHFKAQEQGTEGGLTAFGYKAVKHMLDKGIMIDISHLNDTGVADLIKLSEQSFFASHSNARSHYNVPRNLTDEQIKTIAKRGGVIGINTIKSIVGGTPQTQTIVAIVDHIDYIKGVASSEYIAFGFDLCNMLYDVAVDVLDNHGMAIDITAEMLRRGYSDEECINIMGKNAITMLKDVLK